MKLSLKMEIIVSMILVVIADAYIIYKTGFFGGLLGIISITVMTPMVVMGAHFMINCTGHRYVNGPDWSKMNSDQIQYTMKRVGIVFTVGLIIMTWGIVCIILPDYGFWLFILLLVLSIMILLVGLVKTIKTPPEWVKCNPMTELNKWLVFSVVMILTIVPPTMMTVEAEASDTITIEFFEDRVKIKGPMFDHEFTYEEIDEHLIDDNFKRGSRIIGYSTGTVKSGKYHSDVLGNYELASYNSCDSCIVIKVGSSYYAFNQKTVDITQNVYNELCSRLV